MKVTIERTSTSHKLFLLSAMTIDHFINFKMLFLEYLVKVLCSKLILYLTSLFIFVLQVTLKFGKYSTNSHISPVVV